MYESIPHARSKPVGPGLKACIACGLVSQFSAFAILRAHTVTPVCDSTILLHAELVKMLVSLAFAFRTDIMRQLSDALVPFSCFCAMNLLSFWCLRHVHIALYVLIMQFKLGWTAFFSWMLMGTQYSRTHVCALVVIGLCVSSLSVRHHTRQGDDPSNYLLAVCGLIAETALSGFATSFTQYSFNADINTLWVRNTQLAMLSICAYAPLSVYRECSLMPTGASLLLSGLSALGGILVALNILYVGAVYKTISTSASIALTILLEGQLFRGHVTVDTLLTSAAIIAMCMLYAWLPTTHV